MGFFNFNLIMKKVILLVVLLVTTVTFAQKDELKTLKRIYAKEMASTSDMEEYQQILSNIKVK